MVIGTATYETLEGTVVACVATILRAMGVGADNAREIGIIRVERIDDRAFNVGALTIGSVAHGVRVAASMIGNYLLTKAFLAGETAHLVKYLKGEAAKVEKLKPSIPPIDDRGNLSLDESDKGHLLRKLQRVEKAAIEGTVSRKRIIEAIEQLEDRIANRYCGDDYDRLLGAVEMLANIFGV